MEKLKKLENQVLCITMTLWNVVKCPCCQSTNVVKNGKSKQGKQRYRSISKENISSLRNNKLFCTIKDYLALKTLFNSQKIRNIDFDRAYLFTRSHRR